MKTHPHNPAAGESSANDLRNRLAELASQQESIFAEMERIQQQLEGVGEPAGRPLDPEAIAPHSASDAGELVQSLQQQVAEYDARYKRALADFQNYQRRALENEREARLQGITSVVQSLAPALDNFALALNVDTAKTSAADIRQGVAVIRDEVFRILGSHGLTVIEPKPGDEFDPHRHEAMMQAKMQDMGPNHIVQLFQVGYALRDRTLRPAKVSVSS